MEEGKQSLFADMFCTYKRKENKIKKKKKP